MVSKVDDSVRPAKVQPGTIWLLISRPAIVTVIMGTGVIMLRGQPTFPFLWAYVLIASSVFLSFIYWIGYRFLRIESYIMPIQVVGDVFLITAIVHLSGGYQSPFSLLYFLVIVSASMTGGTRLSVVIASLASICYVLLAYAELRGWLMPPLTLVPYDRPFARNLLFLRAYLHALFFYFIAFLSGYMSERLKARGLELEQVKLTTLDIVEGMPTAVITVDQVGNVVYYNPAAERITGIPSSMVRGKRFVDAFGGHLRPLAEVIAHTAATENSPYRREVEVVQSDGSRRIMGVGASRLLDRTGGQGGVLVLFTDLTDIKEAEEKYRRADHLAAIGELSAGMAHEIRNPLASIRGSVEVLRTSLELDGEERTLMDLILKETDHLNKIVHHFLEFSRLRPLQKLEVDLLTTINDVVELMHQHPMNTSNLTIHLTHRDGPVLVQMDPNQMKQVFLNIGINALQAMNGIGELWITVAETDQVVQVEFRDTGPGIDRDSLDAVFEPFYTKREGGIGLGLSVARSIVDSHGGEITVQSEMGEGCVFTVSIPRKIQRTLEPTGDGV